MTLIHWVFWLLAAVTCGSALVVALSSRLVHSTFALFFCFFGTAGLYVLLGADFLAVTQVIVYIGGILVLLLFGVILTNRFDFSGDRQLPNEKRNLVPGVLLTLGVLYLLVTFPAGSKLIEGGWTGSYDQVVLQADAPAPVNGATPVPTGKVPSGPVVSNTTLPIGVSLLTTYLVPFELASMVLLMAMLGAASIARKEIQ